MNCNTTHYRANSSSVPGDPTGEEGLAYLREVIAETSGSSVDLQGLWPDLTSFARLALRLGRRDEANAVLDQLVEGVVANESGGEPTWEVELVLALSESDRNAEARDVLDRMTPGDARRACEAILSGDAAVAADLLAKGGDGDLRLAAELRLRAAKQLAAAGRLGEAEAQLERAREFWRGVGATAYLREADEVLAAAS